MTDLSCLCEAGAAPAHKARVVFLDVLEEQWRCAECARCFLFKPTHLTFRDLYVGTGSGVG